LVFIYSRSLHSIYSYCDRPLICSKSFNPDCIFIHLVQHKRFVSIVVQLLTLGWPRKRFCWVSCVLDSEIIIMFVTSQHAYAKMRLHLSSRADDFSPCNQNSHCNILGVYKNAQLLAYYCHRLQINSIRYAWFKESCQKKIW